MDNFCKNKKLIILFIVIFVLIIFLIIHFTIFNKNNEKKLNQLLTNMGKDFYENFYYNQNNSTDILKQYEQSGIKVNLENLARYNSDNKRIIKQFINKETKESCDKTNTQVIIYPSSPYNKTSYTLKTELVCGF